MSMNFPFESMSRAISGPSVLVGAGLLSDGCCWCCAGALDTRCCDDCELSGSGLSGCWLTVAGVSGAEGSV